MRKKCAFIVCVALFMPFVCFGFDLGLGIKAGAGHPFFSGNDYDDFLEAATILTGVDAYDTRFSTRFKVGFSGGVYATLGLFDLLALQPEAIFSMGGGAVGFPENTYLYSYREAYNVWMVEVPVLVKLRFGYRKDGEKPAANTMSKNASSPKYAYSKRTKPSTYIMAGPGMAFMLGDGEAVVKIDGEKDSSEPLPDEFFGESYTFLVFGAGLEGFGDRFLNSVEVRYHMGLTSVLDESLDLDDFKQSNVQLLVGFKFRARRG